jgi:hypothetical protein
MKKYLEIKKHNFDKKMTHNTFQFIYLNFYFLSSYQKCTHTYMRQNFVYFCDYWKNFKTFHHTNYIVFLQNIRVLIINSANICKKYICFVNHHIYNKRETVSFKSYKHLISFKRTAYKFPMREGQSGSAPEKEPSSLKESR